MGYINEVLKWRKTRDEKRYIVYDGAGTGGSWDGRLSSLKTVTAAEAVRKDPHTGKWTGRIPELEIAKRIVDACAAGAASGEANKDLDSVATLTWESDSSLRKTLYTAKAPDAVAEERPMPKAIQIHDGSWRKPPSDFRAGPRETKLVIAFVDSQKIPRAKEVSGKDAVGCLEALIRSYDVHLQEFCRTLPFADPEDVPQPTAPVKEHVPTERELAAVEPFSLEEFNRMPSDVYKRRIANDSLFAAACAKMFAIEQEKQVKRDAERAAAAEREELAKRRKQFASEDADAERRGENR